MDAITLAKTLGNPKKAKNIRDGYYSLLFSTVAHEIGHGPGQQDKDTDHEEMGLMAEEVPRIEELNGRFTSKTLLRFRKTVQWTLK